MPLDVQGRKINASLMVKRILTGTETYHILSKDRGTIVIGRYFILKRSSIFNLKCFLKGRSLLIKRLMSPQTNLSNVTVFED